MTSEAGESVSSLSESEAPSELTVASSVLSFSFEPDALLDKAKNNFETWRTRVEETLLLSPPLDLFVLGPVPAKPDATNDAAGYSSWVTNDRIARLLLRRTLSESELASVKSSPTAHGMWTQILTNHGVLTPFQRSDLFMDIVSNGFTSRASFDDTVAKVKDQVHRLYQLGPPSEDDFAFMALLFAAGSRYEMIRDSYLEEVTASGHPTVDALCEHIRADTPTVADPNLRPGTTKTPQKRQEEGEDEVYGTPVELRNYSVPEFHTRAKLTMSTDWAEIELITPGASFRLPIPASEAPQHLSFSSRRINLGPGKFNFQYAELPIVLNSNTQSVDIRIRNGWDEKKKGDNKGWASLSLLGKTYMNQYRDGSADRQFKECPVNYYLRQPALLSVNSNWAEVRVEGSNVNIKKDPYAADFVYDHVSFKPSCLRFDNHGSKGLRRIPFVFTNNGGPIKFSVKYDSADVVADSGSTTAGSASVKFVELGE